MTILALAPMIFISVLLDGNLRAFIASSFMLVNLIFIAHYIKFVDLSKLALIISMLYLFVGIVQDLIYPDFLVALGGRGFAIQGSGRGVSSLASEPSYYAIVSLTMYLLAKSRFPRLSQVLLIVNLMLGKNTLVLVIIGLALLVEFRRLLRLRVLVLTFAILLFVFFFIDTEVLHSTRPIKLIKKFQELGLLKLIYLDRSLADRLGHIVYSNLNLLPRGNSAWIEYINNRDLIFDFDPLNHGRILSWTGSFVFSFGLFGLLWLIILIKRLVKKLNFISISFIFLLLNALPIPFVVIWLPILRDYYDHDL